jgi:hypothetical protein
MSTYEPQPPEYPAPAPATGHVANVKQSRDKAQYMRVPTGHSFLLHWFVLGILTMFIVPIYYSVSPNHFWHV